MGLWVTVQSKSYGPAFLESRVEHFLAYFRDQVLLPMKAGVLLDNITAVVSKWGEKDKKMQERFSRYGSALLGNRDPPEFNLRFQRAKALSEGVSLAEVMAVFDSFIAVGGAQRGKVALHVVAACHRGADDLLLTDMGYRYLVPPAPPTTAAFPPEAPLWRAQRSVAGDPLLRYVGSSKVGIDDFKQGLERFPVIISR